MSGAESIIVRHPSGRYTCEFDPVSHTYTVLETGQRLVSGTTFLSHFFPKFNADKVSKRVAGKGKYKGMRPADVRNQWRQKADQARDDGTDTHLYAEILSNGDVERLPKPSSDRVANLFRQAAVAVLMLEERFIFLEAEQIIFSPDLGIAGTIDWVGFDPKTLDVILGDWKQNEKIDRSNQWENAHPPIDHLEACDWAKYSLQLNLYEYIHDRERYEPRAKRGYRRALIHLKEDSFAAMPVPDMRTEIEAMLKSWREYQNDKDGNAR